MLLKPRITNIIVTSFNIILLSPFCCYFIHFLGEFPLRKLSFSTDIALLKNFTKYRPIQNYTYFYNFSRLFPPFRAHTMFNS